MGITLGTELLRFQIINLSLPSNIQSENLTLVL